MTLDLSKNRENREAAQELSDFLAKRRRTLHIEPLIVKTYFRPRRLFFVPSRGRLAAATAAPVFARLFGGAVSRSGAA